MCGLRHSSFQVDTGQSYRSGRFRTGIRMSIIMHSASCIAHCARAAECPSRCCISLPSFKEIMGLDLTLQEGGVLSCSTGLDLPPNLPGEPPPDAAPYCFCAVSVAGGAGWLGRSASKACYTTLMLPACVCAPHPCRLQHAPWRGAHNGRQLQQDHALRRRPRGAVPGACQPAAPHCQQAQGRG